MATNQPPDLWKPDAVANIIKHARPLNQFLHETNLYLNENLSNPLKPNSITHKARICIGNEAADADSIVSSIVYAFHKSKFDTNSHTQFHIPIISIPRSDFALRCDVRSLFSSLHLDTQYLIFIDEIDWQIFLTNILHQRISIQWILLDHNRENNRYIRKHMQALSIPHDSLHVGEILDHHQDLQSHTDASLRIIAFQGNQALVGSCCTIVTERIVQHHLQNLSDTPMLATLLLAPILQDTCNCNPQAQKATARDIAAIDTLSSISLCNRNPLFSYISHEKSNINYWSQFSILNCLQYDYKQFPIFHSEYGIASIPIPLTALSEKAQSKNEFCQQLQTFMRLHQISFLILMSYYRTSSKCIERELLFYESAESSAEYVDFCINYLLIQQSNALCLEPILIYPDQSAHEMRCFQQHNTSVSRKQMTVLLEQAFHAQRSIKAPSCDA